MKIPLTPVLATALLLAGTTAALTASDWIGGLTAGESHALNKEFAQIEASVDARAAEAAALTAQADAFVAASASHEAGIAVLDAQLASLRAHLTEAIVTDPPELPQDPPSTDPPVINPGGPTTSAYELAPVFSGTGTYGWLGAATPEPGFKLVNWWGELIGAYGPVSIANAEIVGNNDHVTWPAQLDPVTGEVIKPEKKDYGPKWVYRLYDTSGTVENLKVWRAGDWTKGREGHALYANVLADLTIRDFIATQCGAQAIQLVWRASETAIPKAQWKHGEHTILLERVSAIDCGLINEGEAVRASWPISIFNPGQKIILRDCSVETVDAPLAHGALFVGDGEGRTPSLRVDGFRVRVRNSDRPEMRLHGQDDAILTGLDVLEEGGEANVAIADDCTRVEIIDPVHPLVIGIHDASDPHRAPYKTFAVPGGGYFLWPPE